jgi:hypothetical protein
VTFPTHRPPDCDCDAIALLVFVAGYPGIPSVTETPTATDDLDSIRTVTPTSPPTTDVGHYRAHEYEATPITDATMAREVARSPAAVETGLAWRAISLTPRHDDRTTMTSWRDGS